MADVKPVPVGKKVTQEDLARFFDRYVSVYFSDSSVYRETTLGEHLALVTTKLIPDPIRDFITNYTE